VGKRRLEITVFRYQRTIILQQRRGAEGEWVKDSNSYEESSTAVEAVSSPEMRLLIEALVESEAGSARADERVRASRTSFYSKLRRLVFR
jgi:hypothetical protein